MVVNALIVDSSLIEILRLTKKYKYKYTFESAQCAQNLTLSDLASF